ncbi:Lipoprotein signal peptidase [Candidatus Erwinia haradaeae]|uniref:Lipoprotein signal peptidase n=1 Tax=Candidatus Erwinia haradaeae TaxID=1922217 RepID=A0A451D2U2_9GAMM|nr:Lipoprotein signal peptidase [Candidatus Erwinia haradaeae]
MYKKLKSYRLRWLWLSFVVMSLDLLSKEWVISNLFLHQSVSVMPFLNFYYTRNFGMAFSLFSDQNNWQRWLLSGVSSIVIIILFITMYYNPNKKTINYIIYALLIGGALGNLYDRIYRGFVIDFIDLHIDCSHFATFNISDSAICLGTVLIFIQEIINPKK